MMVGSGVYYFVDPVTAADAFTQLGYPAYTMYFNATAKILGGIAILAPQAPRWVKEWAYAGYFFILLLAFQAVYMGMPAGSAWGMLIPIGIFALSYWQFRVRNA